jgi:tRNA wybutosine-synthesizing protein 3
VHENVKDSEEAEWVQGCSERLQQLSRELPGRAGWVAAVRHVERVKWYAPHIRHIVVDVELRPA